MQLQTRKSSEKSFKNYHFSEKSDDVETIYPWYNHVVK